MNTDLLTSWLGLPPGTWPPDDRTLLGLGSGPIDSARVEERALTQMDRLRPYQLLHPELVTEGMNQLARAMIALTTSNPSARPDPGPLLTLELAPPTDTVLGPTVARSPRIHSATAIELPAVIDAEIVEAEAVDDSGLRPGPVPTMPVSRGRASTPKRTADSRRSAYAERARLRRLRRAWLQLQPSFGDPANPVASPAEVCTFLETVAKLRAFAELWEPPPRNRVSIILGQSAPLAVFRTLIPSQRSALARDWSRYLASIDEQLSETRTWLNSTRPRSGLGGLGQFAGRVFTSPELLLVLMSALAVAIALLRHSRGE